MAFTYLRENYEKNETDVLKKKKKIFFHIRPFKNF
jgi:hypothetical protein